MSFQWISNDSPSHDAYITIDKQLRLYVSSKGRKLFGFKDKAPFEMYVGYDPVNKRLVIGKVDVNSTANVKPFKFDRRAYASARPFIAKTDIDPKSLPLRFEYVGRMQSDGMYPSGTYLFQLENFSAPDGGL
ncbi:hypothetical protein ACFVKC_40505 [Streptomyces noursei]|uniref:hypothetical protein n=1 Tax=Streptomyces noursei TaxID=1971 RepID=UPI00362A7EDA